MGIIYSRYVFNPPTDPGYSHTDPGLVWVVTSRQSQIPLLWIPGPEEASTTVVFLHGNMETLGNIREELEALASRGHVNVLGVEYTGYGLADGSPSEANTYADLEAGLEYLWKTTGQATPDTTILMGRSLGSGPAIEVAVRYPDIQGLVLLCPFLSVTQVATGRSLPGDFYRNDTKAPHVVCPVLVFHGTADTVVPIHHGHQLVAAFKGRPEDPRSTVRFIRVKKGTHLGLATTLGIKVYFRMLRSFFLMSSPRKEEGASGEHPEKDPSSSSPQGR